ncbi:hypothetical protein CLF_102930, partial [Clonorchis sinensis]
MLNGEKLLKSVNEAICGSHDKGGALHTQRRDSASNKSTLMQPPFKGSNRVTRVKQRSVAALERSGVQCDVLIGKCSLLAPESSVIFITVFMTADFRVIKISTTIFLTLPTSHTEATECAAPGRLMFQLLRYSRCHLTEIGTVYFGSPSEMLLMVENRLLVGFKPFHPRTPLKMAKNDLRKRYPMHYTLARNTGVENRITTAKFARITYVHHGSNQATECAAPGRLMFQLLRYSRCHLTEIGTVYFGSPSEILLMVENRLLVGFKPFDPRSPLKRAKNDLRKRYPMHYTLARNTGVENRITTAKFARITYVHHGSNQVDQSIGKTRTVNGSPFRASGKPVTSLKREHHLFGRKNSDGSSLCWWSSVNQVESVVSSHREYRLKVPAKLPSEALGDIFFSVSADVGRKPIYGQALRICGEYQRRLGYHEVQRNEAVENHVLLVLFNFLQHEWANLQITTTSRKEITRHSEECLQKVQIGGKGLYHKIFRAEKTQTFRVRKAENPLFNWKRKKTKFSKELKKLTEARLDYDKARNKIKRLENPDREVVEKTEKLRLAYEQQLEFLRFKLSELKGVQYSCYTCSVVARGDLRSSVDFLSYARDSLFSMDEFKNSDQCLDVLSDGLLADVRINIIIIVLGSITSVFNTDAAIPFVIRTGWLNSVETTTESCGVVRGKNVLVMFFSGLYGCTSCREFDASNLFDEDYRETNYHGCRKIRLDHLRGRNGGQLTMRACLGNLAESQPSCFLLVAWRLGTERVLQLNDVASTSGQVTVTDRHIAVSPNDGERNIDSVMWVAVVVSEECLVILIGGRLQCALRNSDQYQKLMAIWIFVHAYDTRDSSSSGEFYPRVTASPKDSNIRHVLDTSRSSIAISMVDRRCTGHILRTHHQRKNEVASVHHIQLNRTIKNERFSWIRLSHRSKPRSCVDGSIFRNLPNLVSSKTKWVFIDRAKSFSVWATSSRVWNYVFLRGFHTCKQGIFPTRQQMGSSRKWYIHHLEQPTPRRTITSSEKLRSSLESHSGIQNEGVRFFDCWLSVSVLRPHRIDRNNGEQSNYNDSPITGHYIQITARRFDRTRENDEILSPVSDWSKKNRSVP